MIILLFVMCEYDKFSVLSSVYVYKHVYETLGLLDLIRLFNVQQSSVFANYDPSYLNKN